MYVFKNQLEPYKFYGAEGNRHTVVQKQRKRKYVDDIMTILLTETNNLKS